MLSPLGPHILHCFTGTLGVIIRTQLSITFPLSMYLLQRSMRITVTCVPGLCIFM